MKQQENQTQQGKQQQISFELIKESQSGMQLSPDFLVIYGLRGKTEISIGGRKYEIETGGLMTVAPFTYLDYDCAKGSNFSVLHITEEVLRVADARSIARIWCYVRDADPGLQDSYDRIRRKYAQMFALFLQNGSQREIRMFACATELLGDLAAYFSSSEPVIMQQAGSETFERCVRIMNYIHAHWREDISIEQLAAQEYVSAGYLSRFFKKFTGITFTEYLVDFRLQNACRDLERTTDTVTKIALANGFKNTNSFIKYFREKYEITPNRYRRQTTAKLLQEENRTLEYPAENADKRDHLPVGKAMPGASAERPEDDNGIPMLLRYAETLEEPVTPSASPAETHLIFLNADAKGESFTHVWRKLLNIGYARYGLLAEVQQQILQAQEEIGYEYVRFHGIVDDDMFVYHEDEKGNPYLDFSRVDLLLDFLLRTGLKPYIELGYMPRLLAKNPVRIFDRDSYISTFNREERWRFLINGLLTHCMERYGRDQVVKWRFTTNGCNSAASGIVSPEDYLHLYQVTRNCVKEADGRILFGGPGGWASGVRDAESIQKLFFIWVKEHDCVPDFICTQCYPHHSIQADEAFWQLTLSQEKAPSMLSADIHYLKNIIIDYKKLLADSGLSHLSLWIEEWNSTIWQRDLSGDTCYKASWLVRNICETDGSVEALGYWTLSDFMEESSVFGRVFHGGFGLFTYNGIPKSGWQALLLLRMLGEEKISVGDGWLAARNSRGMQVILSHYCHYDNLYCLQYKKLTDPDKAYSVFETDETRKYEIYVQGLSDGMYEIRRLTISPRHGSSFDAWLEMGQPEYLRSEEIAYLKHVSQPRLQIETREIHGSHTVECMLAPHEVQMIVISKL